MKIYSDISLIDASASISADQNTFVLVKGSGVGDDTIRKVPLTVNGAAMGAGGNITTALTAVLTGPSASGTNNLIASSSGTVTGSITNATVWVVSGDSSTPDPDGLAYIFVSQSADVGGAGKWFPLSTLNQDQADLRFVRLSVGASNNQNITSSLTITGNNVKFSSSLYWPNTQSMTGGTDVNVLIWDPIDNQIKTTGSYGGGGGSSTPSDLTFGTQTTSYALISSDNNKVVRMNSSTAVNVLVTASNFTNGNQVIVFQSGSGQVTFVPDATTTLLSANDMRKLRTQYSAATLTFSGSICYLFGDIAP